MDKEYRPKHKSDGVYSQKLKAGKRRTYFFDIRATRSNDYYLTITESKRKLNEDGYERHKVFLYKEDFNKFIAALTETIDHVKTELMPEYDFDEFSRKQEEKRKAWAEQRSENNYAASKSEETHSSSSSTNAPPANDTPSSGEGPLAEQVSETPSEAEAEATREEDLSW